MIGINGFKMDIVLGVKFIVLLFDMFKFVMVIFVEVL